MSSQRLRFSPAILRLLGEDLNPSRDQGVLELIKNAYDADATECVVELRGANLPGGSLCVSDNGCGLTPDEIRDGWLVVGTAIKSQQNASPSGRLLVGNKGLGRLAALRLGKRVTLISRPETEPNAEYQLSIDWGSFEQARVVEEVELEICQTERSAADTHGTVVLIEDLPDRWRKSDVNRLARSILLLTDPFHPRPDFRAVLESPEFDAIARRAGEGYFNECDFHLDAELTAEGRASAEVRDGSGTVRYEASHEQIADDKERKCYRAPAARFELWEFKLSGEAFRPKSVTVGDVRNWLKDFGGVRLYHRGIRVLPYGEPQNDWLDMNLRRARSPELRPSTNNSLGCVWIEDPEGILQLKTDRLAFVESEAFDEMRQFTGDVLDWMAGERLRERERRRLAEHDRVRRKSQAAEKKMQRALAGLPTEKRGEVEKAVQEVQKAHRDEVKLLHDTTQLYYTLGTVGTTSAAFAHQTKHPLEGIMQDANALEEYLGDPDKLVQLYRVDSSDAVKRIKTEADAIYTFSRVTLRLLEHEKRRSRRHALHALIEEAVMLLKPYIVARDSIVEYDFAEGNPKVWCSRAALESIVTNFLTNSLQTFATAAETTEPERPAKKGSDERRILIRTIVQDEKVSLVVMDNGSGIEGIAVDDVWLPGRTTTKTGTGLGLTIVRDVVQDLNGTVDASAQGELGGARFVVTLPLKQ